MMKLKYSLSIFAFLFASIIFAQQGDGGTPNGYSYVTRDHKSIDVKTFEQPNIEQLRAEDRINDSLRNGPWRFGYNNETSLDLNNSGTWFTNGNGDQIWLLKIVAEQAKTINLTFKNTQIPAGNELFVYNQDKSFILGSFSQNHIYEGELGTELVPGEVVYVEYFVPVTNSDNVGNVEVSRVTHGYRTAAEYHEKAFGSSGNCNMNVNCPDGADWVNQRNSAVMLVSGGNGFCSGALINNTLNDGTPYVLTANHCYSNPANWVFRFQWQSAGCNNPGSSPGFESLSGATLRARRTPSDMCLVEITGGLSNGTVPQSHTPYFSGWNNSNTAPTSTVSIHHPSGDIKKISFDDDAASAVQAMGSTEPNSSWEVSWDRNTTTEGGSSGSPLFDQDKRIIGQLWGGGASCQNLSAPDYYGRVYNSWNPSGSANNEQLEFWLDPNGSGAESIDGYDPYSNPVDYDAAVTSIEGADGIICGEAAYPSVTIRNNGQVTLTSLDIEYSYNGTPQTINWTGSLANLQSETVSLPYFGAQNGQNTLDIVLSNPNGQADQDPGNNILGSTFTAVIEGETIIMDLVMDCYADEVSWRVEDSNGDVWYSGGGYENPGNATLPISESFCLLEGCYELIIDDSYGDGLNGSVETQCDFDGSMELTRLTNGAQLAELTEANSNFGSSITFPFCAENTASVEEFSTSNVYVFPNPTSGEFTVNVSFSGKKTIRLTDLTGKVIKEISSDKNVVTFNENSVAGGVYLVSVSTDVGTVTKKLIIE
tara:strand:+ start:22981 stop:25275 length:2295 start_codon:yes stop_codon:yes gene_type:complete